LVFVKTFTESVPEIRFLVKQDVEVDDAEPDLLHRSSETFWKPQTLACCASIHAPLLRQAPTNNDAANNKGTVDTYVRACVVMFIDANRPGSE
jgi:hypothetical protein